MGGLRAIPQWIVDGYGTLFDEIDEQIGERDIQLVVVPTGVGSLVQAAYSTTAVRPANSRRPCLRWSR